jgi:hypothetical protein
MSDIEHPFRPEARAPRGLPDRRGLDLREERRILGAVAEVYERWGFEPLETSALEYADALGKFLPDSDRPNEGVFALQDDDEQWMALRYDLTAPLARFAAENWETLPSPSGATPTARCGATRSRAPDGSASSSSATPTRWGRTVPKRTPSSWPWRRKACSPRACPRARRS